jgi:hypothetical protein
VFNGRQWLAVGFGQRTARKACFGVIAQRHESPTTAL